MDKHTILTYGDGNFGSLGLGEHTLVRKKPTVVPNLPPSLLKVAAGGYVNVVVAGDGRVFTWGNNDDGALGRLGSEFVPGPLRIPNNAPIATAACGDSHMVLLGRKGEVYVCGTYRTEEGTTRKPKNPHAVTLMVANHGIPVTQVATSASRGMALLANHYFVEWGVDFHQKSSARNPIRPVPRMFPGKTKIARIFATAHTYFVVSTKGHLYTWGLNNCGQSGLGHTQTPITKPTRVDLPLDLTVRHIVGGTGHTALLTTDGRIYTCGDGLYGKLGYPIEEKDNLQSVLRIVPGLPDQGQDPIVDVGCGDRFTMVATQKGYVYRWGAATMALGTGEDERDMGTPQKLVAGQLEGSNMDRPGGADRRVDAGTQHAILLAT